MEAREDKERGADMQNKVMFGDEFGGWPDCRESARFAPAVATLFEVAASHTVSSSILCDGFE